MKIMYIVSVIFHPSKEPFEYQNYSADLLETWNFLRDLGLWNRLVFIILKHVLNKNHCYLLQFLPIYILSIVLLT